MNAKNDDPHSSGPSSAPPRLLYPPWRRLRNSTDFDRVFAQRRRAADEVLLIFAAENGLEKTRLGLSISRKHGGSVVRHRLRRLIREAYRLEQHRIPEGLDLIAIPGRSARTATLDAFRRSLVRLVKQSQAKRPKA